MDEGCSTSEKALGGTFLLLLQCYLEGSVLFLCAVFSYSVGILKKKLTEQNQNVFQMQKRKKN